MKRLTGEFKTVKEISEVEVHAMYRLLAVSFVNVDFRQFLSDLLAKDRALIFYDAHGSLVGFSTQILFRHVYKDGELRVVFSGDTIIAPEAWGSLELPLLWGDWMLSLHYQEPSPLFWLLISKGIRTYRFLPTFFNEFFPRYDRDTSPETEGLMHDLGARLFHDAYDPSTGLVRPAQCSYYLTPSLAAVPTGRLRNPHVSFFMERNSTYHRGSELLCLARFQPDNLKADYCYRLERRAAAGRRLVANG